MHEGQWIGERCSGEQSSRNFLYHLGHLCKDISKCMIWQIRWYMSGDPIWHDRPQKLQEFHQ